MEESYLLVAFSVLLTVGLWTIVGAATNCYTCADIEDPRRCQNYTVCEKNETQCFVEELLTLDGSLLYALGCISEAVCNATATIPIGRRQDGQGITTCIKCCSEDNCNEWFCKDNCEKQPCQNDGNCTTTGSKTYNCTCPAGFTGANCEVDIDECHSSPCQNNGTCIDQVNGFRCHCPMTNFGTLCERDACTSRPCQHGSKCHISGANFTCSCLPGFTGHACETNIDECASSPCQHGGKCTDLVNGFNCSCFMKYTGKFCEQTKPGVVCLHCHGLNNPALCTNLTLCSVGEECFVDELLLETGATVFNSGCRPRNICDMYTNLTSNSIVSVSARQAFQITVCSQCCTEDYCNRKHCISRLHNVACLTCQGLQKAEDCHNVSICEPNNACYTEEAIDLTNGNKVYNLGCEAQNVCQSLGGTHARRSTGNERTALPKRQSQYLNTCFRCCSENYCNDSPCRLDMCKSNPCLNHGNCTTINGTFHCSCSKGFDGLTCDVYNPCSSSPCLNGGTCSVVHSTSISRTYHCYCRKGFTGPTCALPDVCNSSTCLNGGTCNVVNTNDFACFCQNGFKGKTCDLVDYCAASPCLNGGICNSTALGFSCLCKKGFQGHTCESVEICNASSCLNGGTCRNHTIGCVCKAGFQGNRCEIKMSRAAVQCMHGGSPTPEGTCTCPVGYTGFTCETLDPCFSLPCQNGGSCSHNSLTGYTCLCHDTHSGPNCEIDSICSPSPCQHSGTCIDTHGVATCLCRTNYTGAHCESLVQTIQTHPPSSCSYPLADIRTFGCGVNDDVVFLIEEGHSESPANIRYEGDFIYNLFDSFNLKAKVAIIGYSNVIKFTSQFTADHADFRDNLHQIRHETVPENVPDLANALNYTLHDVFLPANGARIDGNRIVVAIVHETRAPSELKIADAARSLRDACISLVVYTVSEAERDLMTTKFNVEEINKALSYFGTNHLQPLREFGDITMDKAVNSHKCHRNG